MKVARAEMNITQGELAEKIGVTRQAVNSIELGKYVPSTVLALKMAKLFVWRTFSCLRRTID